MVLVAQVSQEATLLVEQALCVVDGFDDGSKDPPSTCYQLRETYQSEREEHIVFLIKYP